MKSEYVSLIHPMFYDPRFNTGGLPFVELSFDPKETRTVTKDIPLSITAGNRQQWWTFYRNHDRQVHDIGSVLLVPFYRENVSLMSTSYTPCWFAMRNGIVFAYYWFDFNSARADVKAWLRRADAERAIA